MRISARQCEHLIQPGEYMIDKWDGQRCTEKTYLHKCEICGKTLCMLFHFGRHTCQAN